MQTQECLLTLEGHEDFVYSCTQLYDGRIVSCSEDKTLKIWDVDSGRCLSTLVDDSASVWACVQLKNGLLASGSSDGTTKLWHVMS